MEKRVGSGRTKGTPNRKTEELQALLDRLGCDPRELMAMIVNNELPCGVCRGKGETPYLLPAKMFLICEHCKHSCESVCNVCPKCGYEPARQIEMRTCQSCKQTLFEACSPALRGSQAAELLQYLLPKRKAVEVSAPGGGAVQHVVRVVYVKPGNSAS